MLPPSLPPLDPDFLFIERDPDVLDSYARGLLVACSSDLRRKFKLPAAPGHYPIEAAACWLFDAYADARLPPSPSAARLFRKLLAPKESASTSPVREKSRKAFWSAIKFEAQHRPDDDPNAFDEQGRVKAYRVAKYLVEAGLYKDRKTAEDNLRHWRTFPEYKSNVEFQRDPRAWARSRKR